MQAYPALPFNITSGVTTVQGTPGRPIVDGAYIERNAGVGSDFFNVSLRLARVQDCAAGGGGSAGGSFQPVEPP